MMFRTMSGFSQFNKEIVAKQEGRSLLVFSPARHNVAEKIQAAIAASL